MSKSKEALDDKNWYKDRYQYVLVQRKLLTLITVASLLCTLAAISYLSYLTPLKSIEPYVIEVDQKTGITQVVDPMTVKELTANEAVNNYFIVMYIRAREGYSMTDLARSYNLVRVMSESRKVYPQFVSEADPNNPRSNAARLGTFGERTVKLKSIVYLNPQLVQIRVLIEERGGAAPQHKFITLAFEYVKMNLTLEERYLNPLGFRVTDYRVDEDILQK